MRCIIRKAQSVKLDELPVKTCEELPLPIGFVQPSTKLSSLSLPPSAALFGTAVGTPSNPNTPVFHGTSPSFTSFTLETPSPTFSAFPFSSISPTTFSFPTADVNAGSVASEANMSFGRQDKKPDTPKQSTLANPLKILLKRKRDDEYVIEKFQVPEELPKNEAKVPSGQHGPGSSGIGSDGNISDAMDSDNFTFDLTAVSAANFNVGTTFSEAATGLDGSAVVSSGNASGLASTDSIAVASGLVLEGLPTSADMFDIGGTGADGTDLEGILQNLSGASHLPPGIVPGGSALDFDTGLGMFLRLLVRLLFMCCDSIFNLA